MFCGSADGFDKAFWARNPLVAKDILLLTVHQEEVGPAHRIMEKLIASLRLIHEIIVARFVIEFVQHNERDVGIILYFTTGILLRLKANANVDVRVRFFIIDDQELSRKRAERDSLSFRPVFKLEDLGRSLLLFAF